MSTSITHLPLGQARLLMDKRVKDFADASGRTPEAIWEMMSTAATIPGALCLKGLEAHGKALWDGFQELRSMEAAALKQR